MTVSELINYLKGYEISGKGNSIVCVANQCWNPITEAEDIVDAVFIESYQGAQRVVLQHE